MVPLVAFMSWHEDVLSLLTNKLKVPKFYSLKYNQEKVSCLLEREAENFQLTVVSVKFCSLLFYCVNLRFWQSLTEGSYYWRIFMMIQPF